MKTIDDLFVAAIDLKLGDAIYDRNGFGYCSTTVTDLQVSESGLVVYVGTRLGTRKYYSEETVEISRWK